MTDAAFTTRPTLSDGVQKRRLAVVDVTHDGDDGRPGLQVLGGIVEREGVLLLLRHDLDVHAEVIRNELDEVIGHGLGDGERCPHEEQTLDDVIGGHAQKLGKVGDFYQHKSLYFSKSVFVQIVTSYLCVSEPLFFCS